MGFFADVFDAVKENVKNSQARVTTNLFPLSNQKPYSKKPFDFETKEARRKTFLNFMTHSCNALFVPIELLCVVYAAHACHAAFWFRTRFLFFKKNCEENKNTDIWTLQESPLMAESPQHFHRFRISYLCAVSLNNNNNRKSQNTSNTFTR